MQLTLIQIQAAVLEQKAEVLRVQLDRATCRIRRDPNKRKERNLQFVKWSDFLPEVVKLHEELSNKREAVTKDKRQRRRAFCMRKMWECLSRNILLYLMPNFL
jgi:hypothetical protein